MQKKMTEKLSGQNGFQSRPIILFLFPKCQMIGVKYLTPFFSFNAFSLCCKKWVWTLSFRTIHIELMKLVLFLKECKLGLDIKRKKVKLEQTSFKFLRVNPIVCSRSWPKQEELFFIRHKFLWLCIGVGNETGAPRTKMSNETWEKMK